ncbi:hypothetical protein STEG23_026432, partial [Scotinomys teguina]
MGFDNFQTLQDEKWVENITGKIETTQKSTPNNMQLCITTMATYRKKSSLGTYNFQEIESMTITAGSMAISRQ